MNNKTKRNIRIHQQYLNLDDDSPTRHMILIEENGSQPLKSYVVELPAGFEFYNIEYKYYQINQN
jgi:hypothetical protein